MKQIRLLTLLIAVMMHFPACAGGAEEKSGRAVYTGFGQIENKRIGVITGTVQAIQAEARFPRR